MLDSKLERQRRSSFMMQYRTMLSYDFMYTYIVIYSYLFAVSLCCMRKFTTLECCNKISLHLVTNKIKDCKTCETLGTHKEKFKYLFIIQLVFTV